MKDVRVLIIDNGLMKAWGNGRLSTNMCLCNGAIRNNYRLYSFSDRDMRRFLSPLGIHKFGGWIACEMLLKVVKNFRPNAVLIGHCEFISNSVLDKMREIVPEIRIGHINVDSPYPPWHGEEQITQRMKSCDSIFVTTAGPILKKFLSPGKVISWIPNPCDPAVDVCNNGAKTDGFERDLIFAAALDPRESRAQLLRNLMDRLEKTGLTAAYPGCFGRPMLFGYNFEHLLATSKMALNISRLDPKWYSSDRIAHLMGNGLLTFQSDKAQFQHFFSNEEMVFFSEAEDLYEKVMFYHKHDDARQRVASAGRAAYHRMFSAQRVLKFMIETLFEEKYTEDYEWMEEVYKA